MEIVCRIGVYCAFLSCSVRMRTIRLSGRFFAFLWITGRYWFCTDTDDTIFQRWYVKICILIGSRPPFLDHNFCIFQEHRRTHQVVFYDQMAYARICNGSSRGLWLYFYRIMFCTCIDKLLYLEIFYLHS